MELWKREAAPGGCVAFRFFTTLAKLLANLLPGPLGMAKSFWTLGCIFALTAVAAGAFATHALRARLPDSLLDIFQTGARYQMYHALALLFVARAVVVWPGRLARLAGWLFVVGILFFSGTLYVLATTGIGWLGAITPIGGAAFLVGWVLLALAPWRGEKPA